VQPVFDLSYRTRGREKLRSNACQKVWDTSVPSHELSLFTTRLPMNTANKKFGQFVSVSYHIFCYTHPWLISLMYLLVKRYLVVVADGMC
jgi:hypothetical protein